NHGLCRERCAHISLRVPDTMQENDRTFPGLRRACCHADQAMRLSATSLASSRAVCLYHDPLSGDGCHLARMAPARIRRTPSVRSLPCAIAVLPVGHAPRPASASIRRARGLSSVRPVALPDEKVCDLPPWAAPPSPMRGSPRLDGGWSAS